RSPAARDGFAGGRRERAPRLTIGPGRDNHDLGPIVSQEQHRKVTGYIADGLASGARLRFGGRRPAHLNRGYFVEPTLFDQVLPDMRIAREEIFGPVGVALDFTSEDEALAIANDLPYGLVAGIYTRDVGRALRFAQRIEAGSEWINGWDLGGVQAPTGGIKDSGIGRQRGRAGIRKHLEIKNRALGL